MCGSHCLKTYKSFQDIVELSSGEDGFYGTVRAGRHGLGMVGLCQDLGLQFSPGLIQTPALRGV